MCFQIDVKGVANCWLPFSFVVVAAASCGMCARHCHQTITLYYSSCEPTHVHVRCVPRIDLQCVCSALWCVATC